MTKIWQMGKWMKTNQLHVGLAYNTSYTIVYVLSHFSRTEDTVEVCGTSEVVESLYQRNLVPK